MLATPCGINRFIDLPAGHPTMAYSDFVSTQLGGYLSPAADPGRVLCCPPQFIEDFVSGLTPQQVLPRRSSPQLSKGPSDRAALFPDFSVTGRRNIPQGDCSAGKIPYRLGGGIQARISAIPILYGQPHHLPQAPTPAQHPTPRVGARPTTWALHQCTATAARKQGTRTSLEGRPWGLGLGPANGWAALSKRFGGYPNSAPMEGVALPG